MNKQDIIELFRKSDLYNKWHFFKYHFNFYELGHEHPLAKSIVEMIVEIENKVPNSGVDYINKIASINDKKNETKHYDQLLQILAELMIVHKAMMFPWGDKTVLKYEPKSATSKKNPELTISNENISVGIEVKAPELVKKHNDRATKPQQLPSRSSLISNIDKDNTMLPRDNPVKDFLISANGKFEGFKNANPKFCGILIIVWDDFIYEPISALSSPQAGLFTENSFALEAEDSILKFPNVDCVIITRHLLPISRGTRDEPLPDNSRHPLDYGRQNEFPFKIIIPNPWNNIEIPNEVIECFQVLTPGPELGAEYLPTDFITWLK